MKTMLWFRCGRTLESTSDYLAELRATVRDLYREDLARQFGLISVTLPVGITGFDKLAIRLSYARLVKQVTDDSGAAMTASGRVLGLLADGPGMEGTLFRLRDALIQVTPQGHQPRLLWERLPDFEASALVMLDDLSG